MVRGPRLKCLWLHHLEVWGLVWSKMCSKGEMAEAQLVCKKHGLQWVTAGSWEHVWVSTWQAKPWPNFFPRVQLRSLLLAALLLETVVWFKEGRDLRREGGTEAFFNNAHFGEEAFEKRTEYTISCTASPFLPQGIQGGWGKCSFQLTDAVYFFSMDATDVQEHCQKCNAQLQCLQITALKKHVRKRVSYHGYFIISHCSGCFEVICSR